MGPRVLCWPSGRGGGPGESGSWWAPPRSRGPARSEPFLEGWCGCGRGRSSVACTRPCGKPGSQLLPFAEGQRLVACHPTDVSAWTLQRSSCVQRGPPTSPRQPRTSSLWSARAGAGAKWWAGRATVVSPAARTGVSPVGALALRPRPQTRRRHAGRWPVARVTSNPSRARTRKISPWSRWPIGSSDGCRHAASVAASAWRGRSARSPVHLVPWISPPPPPPPPPLVQHSRGGWSACMCVPHVMRGAAAGAAAFHKGRRCLDEDFVVGGKPLMG